MLTGAVLLRPRDEGAPYEPYFRTLNEELKKRGPGRPVMILDLDRVDQNLDAISASIRPPKRYRIVAKSLPSIPLLDYAMKRTGSSRLMAFHQPALSAIAQSLPRSEVLLGKPLPVAAARRFYHSLGSRSFDPDLQVQWLIDSRDRLLQYQQLARELGRPFRINVEIDVGDHRGNVRDTDMLDGILREIAGDPDHLSFAGLMGYDAYIAGFTPAWRRRLLADVLDRYQAFVDFVRERHPSLFHDRLTFNGAGSQTFRLYEDDRLLNDLAAGSGVVKPTDFDMDLLDRHQPALFIATPILKRRDRLEIPVAGWLGSLMTSWNPNRQQAFFIYGGFWKAHFESPGGLVTNPIYGRSSNSEMVNASNRVSISVDDHVFLRPTQSEDVMLQFGNLLCVRQGAIVDEWPPLSEDPIGFAQDTPAS